MAQTREEATLLMLTRLEECGLAEGSQFRDLGGHGLLSLSLLGDSMMDSWVPRHVRHAWTKPYTKTHQQEAMSASDKPFEGRRKPYPDTRKRL
jgi:hypothetical protein